MSDPNHALPSLTVAVSTFGDNIKRLTVADFKPRDGVTYLILAQHTPPDVDRHMASALTRADIAIKALPSTGAAHSRNAAIEHATSDLLLFADDDIELLGDQYSQLRQTFQKSPQMDFGCFQIQTPSGQPFKKYPPHGVRVSKLNCGRVGTPEMAIRLSSFQKTKIRFDPSFGAGTALYSGDEYIFLCDALRAGFSGQHISLTLATHEELSTGHGNSSELFKIRKAALKRALKPWSWPYRLAFAVKHFDSFPSWKSFAEFILP